MRQNSGRVIPTWEYYREGKIKPIHEDMARNLFQHWRLLSDDRAASMLMIDQMWAEIDRQRELVAKFRDEAAAMMARAMIAELAAAVVARTSDHDMSLKT